MKQAELFHPRIFDTKEWAVGYYKRNNRSIERMGHRIVELLKSNGFTGGKVLDVGCGFAAIPVEIAREFPNTEITGIDMGEPILELGRKLVRQEGMQKQIKLERADAQDLPFESDSFDLVISTFLFHIVEDPASMLNEIERVTKSDGKIMITDLRRGWLAYAIREFRKAYTLSEARHIFQKTKLREGKLSVGPFWWDYEFNQSPVYA
jgi:ubiquinone/menaquinone biosynthesis C-methylase UbiE